MEVELEEGAECWNQETVLWLVCCVECVCHHLQLFSMWTYMLIWLVRLKCASNNFDITEYMLVQISDGNHFKETESWWLVCRKVTLKLKGLFIVFITAKWKILCRSVYPDINMNRARECFHIIDSMNERQTDSSTYLHRMQYFPPRIIIYDRNKIESPHTTTIFLENK